VGRQFSGGGESAVLLYLSISGENNVRGISLTITPIPRGPTACRGCRKLIEMLSSIDPWYYCYDQNIISSIYRFTPVCFIANFILFSLVLYFYWDPLILLLH
jgi:hypothetical protein